MSTLINHRVNINHWLILHNYYIGIQINGLIFIENIDYPLIISVYCVFLEEICHIGSIENLIAQVGYRTVTLRQEKPKI
jgi:hypothetical protein